MTAPPRHARRAQHAVPAASRRRSARHGRDRTARNGTVAVGVLLGGTLLIASSPSATARPEAQPASLAAPSVASRAVAWTEQRIRSFDVGHVLPAPHLPAASVTVVPEMVPSLDAEEGVRGIPDRVLYAYRSTAQRLGGERPSCGVSWSLLAAIGRVESGHGSFGGSVVNASGAVTPPIYGTPGGGSPDNPVTKDSDGGRYDGDPSADRGVGLMQTLPGTWVRYAVDGNRDGSADPQDVDDATLTAARYLCDAGADLHKPAGIVQAVYSYNRSVDYVRLVLTLAAAYGSTTPDALGVYLLPPVDPDAPVTTLLPLSVVGSGAVPAQTADTAPPPSTRPPASAPVAVATASRPSESVAASGAAALPPTHVAPVVNQPAPSTVVRTPVPAFTPAPAATATATPSPLAPSPLSASATPTAVVTRSSGATTSSASSSP